MTKQQYIAVMKHYKAQLDDAFKCMRHAKGKEDKDFYISCIEILADNLRSEARSAKSAEWGK